MARMAELALQLEEIDAEIIRLHEHATAKSTEELATVLDFAQIDALLERRYSLWPKTPATADDPSDTAATRPA